MKIQISTASLIGGRTENEDTLAVFHNLAVLPDETRERTTAVVCDGLGGHAAGKTASSTASKAFIAHCRKNSQTDPATRLRGALDAANAAVRDAIEKNRRLTGMGTTLVAVEVETAPDATRSEAERGTAPVAEAHWISVGDSPLWSCQDDEMCELVNTMHNVPGSRHRLTSAVMGQDEIEDIDQGSIEFPAGDTLVVASDGLDALEKERLRHLTRTTHIFALATILAEEAVAAGGPKADNTTAIAIQRSIRN